VAGLRDVRASAERPGGDHASDEGDGASLGAAADDARSLTCSDSLIYSSSAIKAQRVRFPCAFERGGRFQTLHASGSVAPRFAEAPDHPDHQKDDDKTDAFMRAHAGTGARHAHHSDGYTAGRKSRGTEKIAGVRSAGGSRCAVLSTLSRIGGSQDSETEAGSAEAGPLSQVGEGFDGALVRSETAPKDDGHAQLASFRRLHQGGTISGALPTLSATLCEFSEKRRQLSASLETADLGSRQTGYQLGPKRQRQLLRDLHAQGLHFASDSRESTGTNFVPSERSRLRVCGEDIHCSRGSTGLARDSAGVALVGTQQGGADSGRPTFHARGAQTPDDFGGEQGITTADALQDSDDDGSVWRMLHLRRWPGQSLSTTGHTGFGGTESDPPVHDLGEEMSRYTVNGRLLVNCENVFASKPAGGGRGAAKRGLNAAESEAVVDGPLKQEGQKRPASRGRSKRDA
jgi:hypothetical protein